jgi:hypothetical protein
MAMAKPLRHGTTNVNLNDEGIPPIELVRLGRIGRELRLTDQILSYDLDTLSIVDTGVAPAWTTLEGDHISFAMDKMPLLKGNLEVAVWLGTNAHELGHVLFSPRRGSPLMQQVIRESNGGFPGLAQLHNILEDQRQERLILGRFAPWRAYLTAALGHHLVVADDSAWLLLCGRTWLPEATRAQAKARFVVAYNQTIADEVAVIVGEYQRLSDPGFMESNEAWTLLTQLYNLLPSIPPLPKGGGCTVMTGGQPSTDQPSGDMPPTADEADGDESGEGSGEQSSDGEDGQSSSGSEGSKDASDLSGDGSGGKGAGPGDKDSTPPPMTTKDVKRDLAKAASQQLENDREAKAELDGIMDAIRNGRGSGELEGEIPQGRIVDATDRAKALHHEVSDALLDLKDEAEPGWVKRTDSGRLKAARLAKPNFDPDELFDHYEPGQMDASELEMVLLLDVSGSMSHATMALSEAAWAIRQAVDNLEGSCSVITYSSGDRVLAGPKDRPDGRMFQLEAWGGTDPNSSLEESYRLLADSSARNRLVVILTDGQWWEPSGSTNKRTPQQVIAAMNQAGIITAMALYGAGAGEDGHGCRHAANINNPHDLARLFRQVAAARIADW